MPRIIDPPEALHAQRRMANATRWGRPEEVQRLSVEVLRYRAANLRKVADDIDAEADAVLASMEPGNG